MDNQNLTPLQTFLLRFAPARMLVLFGFHAIVFAGCYALAYLLRFDFEMPANHLERLRATATFVVGTQLSIGALFGFYRGWWRYVGVGDVVRLVFGLTTALAVLLTAWYAAPQIGVFSLQTIRAPRSVLLIQWAFSIILLLGTRVMIRLGRDRFRPNETGQALKRVILIGAGDAGESLAREIEHRPQLGMKVVAFVDDHRAKWGSMIRGIRVFGPISEVASIADSVLADEALIAMPSASGKRLREVIHHLSAADLNFKTIPGLDQLVTGRVQVNQLRPVNIEDLLRRERIDLPGDPVRTLFRGRRVLVTGAGGTIGSELCSQILQLEPESLTLVERSEFALYECRKRLAHEASWTSSRIESALVDVQDLAIVKSLLQRVRPHIVLHAAAHKHVPLGEENPPEYVRNNALATRSLADICEAEGVERFVLISTDKAINPTSVMGASKRAAEILLLDVAERRSMQVNAVRFGNVLGSSGSVIPLFLEQVARGGPITVTHPDVTRYFLRTSEAVSLVLQAASLGNQGEIFMLDMGEPLKIADLARDLLRLSNLTEDDVPIVFTGLRPGEKLFEEIELHGESVRPTIHPRIVVTVAPQPNHASVTEWKQRLALACAGGTALLLSVLCELIPEYTAAPDHRIQHPSIEPGLSSSVAEGLDEPRLAPAG